MVEAAVDSLIMVRMDSSRIKINQKILHPHLCQLFKLKIRQQKSRLQQQLNRVEIMCKLSQQIHQLKLQPMEQFQLNNNLLPHNKAHHLISHRKDEEDSNQEDAVLVAELSVEEVEDIKVDNLDHQDNSTHVNHRISLKLNQTVILQNVVDSNLEDHPELNVEDMKDLIKVIEAWHHILNCHHHLHNIRVLIMFHRKSLSTPRIILENFLI
jgi:hypothetical protein